MKYLKALLMLLLCSALLCACAPDENAQTAAAPTAAPVLLGFSQLGSESAWRVGSTRSIEEAAALAGEDAVLMGGAQLYRALLPHCERVLVTQVDAAAEGADAFFPNLDAAPDWTAETVGEWQEENGLRFRYVDYVRRT